VTLCVTTSLQLSKTLLKIFRENTEEKLDKRSNVFTAFKENWMRINLYICYVHTSQMKLHPLKVIDTLVVRFFFFNKNSTTDFSCTKQFAGRSNRVISVTAHCVLKETSSHLRGSVAFFDRLKAVKWIKAASSKQGSWGRWGKLQSTRNQ
jgi:hypothetical protein